MRIKAYSLMIGYKEFDATLNRSVNPPVLDVQGYGPVSSLEWIKHGFKVVEASPAEITRLRAAGFQV